MLENIEYLPKKNEFRIGDVKNLAVANNQKNDISKMYPRVETNVVSNADMLSQSFGGSQTQVTETPKVETISEPVQVSAIPNVQNSFNMESNPVDLNVDTSLDNINQPIGVTPTAETSNLNGSFVDTQGNNNVSLMENNFNLATNNPPVIEPINSNNLNNPINLNTNPIDSGFNVSNQPNIFDNPNSTTFTISQDDINKPLDNSISEVPDVNIFANPNSVSSIQSSKTMGENKDIVEETIKDDIILAEIAIEESNVKHYEALAENSKKKIELLKRQVKNTKKEDVNLENTASNLFNNNGVLDDEKVLGKTPMPNIMAA